MEQMSSFLSLCWAVESGKFVSNKSVEDFLQRVGQRNKHRPMKEDQAYRMYLRKSQAGLPAEIVLGSPKSASCRHFGVCRIYFLGETLLIPACADRVSGYLRREPQTGRLLVHFLVDTLSVAIREKHFAEGYFRITHPYTLRRDLSDKLDFPEGDHQLCPGKYPVMDDGHLLTVSLALWPVAAAPARPEELLAA